jgi:hypothetical protein
MDGRMDGHAEEREEIGPGGEASFAPLRPLLTAGGERGGGGGMWQMVEDGGVDDGVVGDDVVNDGVVK